METNVGTLDRIARAILGVVLIAAPFISGLAFFESTLGTVISVAIGVVMLGTSATRVCPLYTVFGLKTCRRA